MPITEPSLGLLIANGYQYMLSGKYWISFYPGIALLVTIVAINLVGDQLRDVLNPQAADDDRSRTLEVRNLRTHFFTRAGVVEGGGRRVVQRRARRGAGPGRRIAARASR